ncbi:hypothetical protein Poly30_13970 [Planctomycetes bacterium Poly30]|uniref:FG-GAP repeat protein n=1 Tax=Saltatorellus ferox TaxID=2528018 RepID=A0A518EP79_9BACT|nr:hypothetical protein Poly30_13970 [Planctomycetes bacterium Poly30]
MLPLLATATLYAALAATSPAPLQANLTVLLTEGQPLPTGQVATEVISGPVLDRSAGGYFVLLRADQGPPEIWHDPDGVGPLPLAFFHQPSPPANHTFLSASLDAASGGHVAWRMTTRRVQLGIAIDFDSVWVDSTRAWRPSDPSPIAGSNWLPGYPFIAVTATGELLLQSRVSNGTGQGTPILANVTTGQVLYQPGDPIGNTGESIGSVGEFATSPNGLSVVVRVSTTINPCFNGTSIDWLLRDGEPLRLNGVPIRTGMNLPASAGAAAGKRVERVSVGAVTDAGETLLPVYYGNTACAFPTDAAYFRGDQFLTAMPTSSTTAPSFLLPSGLLGSRQQAGLDIEGVSWVTPASGIDVDRDGVLDVGWSLHDLQANGGMHIGYRSDAESRIYARLRIRQAGSPPVTAFVAVEDRLHGETYCDGTPNSTGRGAKLTAFGSEAANDNDLTLLTNSLPSQSFGYALVSRTDGMVVQPGGSQGTLCLGGAIGRFLGATFQSGSTGSSITSMNLNALPQPMGTASAMAGEVWRFQVWYRDAVNGQATSNFSAAITVTLQ